MAEPRGGGARGGGGHEPPVLDGDQWLGVEADLWLIPDGCVCTFVVAALLPSPEVEG